MHQLIRGPTPPPMLLARRLMIALRRRLVLVPMASSVGGRVQSLVPEARQSGPVSQRQQSVHGP